MKTIDEALDEFISYMDKEAIKDNIYYLNDSEKIRLFGFALYFLPLVLLV